MTRPRSGIRRVDEVDGGVIAWLYGETDLDDVMLELAGYVEKLGESWTERIWQKPAGTPEPVAPDAPLGDPAWRAWDRAWDAYRAAGDHAIREDHPTGYVFDVAPDEADVGWFRRFPWCACGEGHVWHYEESAPGRGASLAVLVIWSE